VGSGALMEYRDDGAHLRFPRGFLWGSGTSAYQFEGGDYRCDWSESERRGEIRAPGWARQRTSGTDSRKISGLPPSWVTTR
jgi:hypothetical protein